MADEPAAPNPSTPASPAAPPAATPTPAAAPPTDPAAPPAAAPPEPPKPVVPEKYDFKALKLPEGITLDTPLLSAVEPVFKELGLSQEGASKLVEAHAKALAAAEVAREADFKTWMANQVKQHQAALKSEWGTAYDANVTLAQRGIARIMSPAAKALLDETGLGNHPEFVKAFYQVGKMVSEDTPPAGGVPAGVQKSAAEVLYGSTTPNH